MGERALIFPGAAVVGDVTLGEDVSVWYGRVLRGDLRPVTVGARTVRATSAPTASSATAR